MTKVIRFTIKNDERELSLQFPLREFLLHPIQAVKSVKMMHDARKYTPEELVAFLKKQVSVHAEQGSLINAEIEEHGKITRY